MKEFLRKRPAALFVTVAVIALSTLFSVHRTLGAQCRKITDGFYTGVRYDGYTHPSISNQLGEKADAANGILSIADSYPALAADASALSEARMDLINALKSEDIAAVSEANRALQISFDKLAASMAGINAAERDVKGFETYAVNFRGAQAAIDNSDYNESVREFNRSVLNVFPTDMLAGLAGVEKPLLFE